MQNDALGRSVRQAPPAWHAPAAALTVAAFFALDAHHRVESAFAGAVGMGVSAVKGAGLGLGRAVRQGGDIGPGFVVAGLVTAALAIGAFAVLRAAPGKRFGRLVALAALVGLGVVGLDTLGYGGGVAFPLGVAVMALPTLALVALRETGFGNALLSAGFWGGFGWLVASGAALLLGSDDFVHRHRQADHAQVGLVWAPFLLAWCWDHLRRTDGERGGAIRWSGFAALALLALEGLSGVATLVLPGEAVVSQSLVHAILGGAALAATGLHVALRLVRGGQRRPHGRPTPWVTGLIVVSGVLSLGASVASVPDPAPVTVRVADGQASGTLSLATLGAGPDTIGCGSPTGCHPAQQAA